VKQIAMQTTIAQVGTESRVHSWKSTSASEKKLFPGMAMLMGVMHKTNLDMWCKMG